MSWSMGLEFLEKKLQHEFWVSENVGMKEVMEGHYGYGITYPILERVTERYGVVRREWEESQGVS